MCDNEHNENKKKQYFSHPIFVFTHYYYPQSGFHVYVRKIKNILTTLIINCNFFSILSMRENIFKNWIQFCVCEKKTEIIIFFWLTDKTGFEIREKKYLRKNIDSCRGHHHYNHHRKMMFDDEICFCLCAVHFVNLRLENTDNYCLLSGV